MEATEVREIKEEVEIEEKKHNTVLCIIFFILFGAGLGIFVKFVDVTATGELPYLVKLLDMKTFLGEYSLWFFIGLCIAIYSATNFRAGLFTFLFYISFVSAYYMYAQYVDGFFPKSYVMLWFGFAIFSPFIALLCRIARRKGVAGVIMRALITFAMFTCTFNFGMFYVDFKNIMDLFVFVLTIIVVIIK